jgi:tetratricopeptide (TPR) repeat protein
MVDGNDKVFVMDFGLAKSLEQSGMTQAGAIVGTPYYMSPEQVKGEPTDDRSDIYSLGIMLYEMSTGDLPYTGRTPYEVMVQRTLKAPRPPEELNPDIPVYLRHIIKRCLSVQPALRYASVGEIFADLTSGTFRPTMRYRVQRHGWLFPAGLAVVLAALIGLSTWALRHRRATPAAGGPKTESVLIADFQNKTGDPVFDGTLEPSFGLALEGASFLTSYNRGQARKIAAQLKPGATTLDQPLARLVALREGIQVVTSGSIERKDSDYVVSVTAVDAVTGKQLVSEEQSASGKDKVLSTIGELAASVRAALGDTTPRSLQLAAAETFTAGSVEAAHEYAVAQDSQYAGNYEDATKHYLKAIELDPDMGRADAGIAVLYSNQGRRDEAEKYYALAMARIDRMSDREKFRTRGGYYLIVHRDPDKAIEEYGALVGRYPADTAGISNLALAYFYKRNMAKALEEGRRAIAIYPKNVPQKNNVGLYAMYAGEFETAIREQSAVIAMNPKFDLAYVGLALSQLAQGHPDLAAETYRKLAAIDPRGASVAASGLADIDLYQGRPKEAAAILEKGIEADLARKDPESAAVKLAALASARLEMNQTAPALAAAERAISLAKGENVLYSAARVYIAAGKEPQAMDLAKTLSTSLEPDPQTYAELLRAELEAKRGNPREAIKILQNAKKTADTWMGRYLLGRAYLDAQAFPEADSELEAAFKRRGEATALFLDEAPTFRLFPQVEYWLARAREGIKSPAAADSYKAFLGTKTNGTSDPLVVDARRRLGAR